VQGFCARALQVIPQYTIITEYTGELELKNDSCVLNDSVMFLKESRLPGSDIVISPELFANLGRYISGINNNDPNSFTKVNVIFFSFNYLSSIFQVQSGTFRIQDRLCVLLFACRDIQEGSTLYYDYNAGDNGCYPTEGFQ
jgi:hypothetical protein